MMVNIICKNLNNPMVIRGRKPANDPFLFAGGDVTRKQAVKLDPIFLCDDGQKKA